MGTIPARTGNTFVDDSLIGAVGLSNPDNAKLEDGTYVTWILLLGQGGHYLKATDHLTGFPKDSTPTGFLVSIKKSSTLGSAVDDLSVRLVVNGTIQGNDKASATTWPTSDAWIDYGSLTDLWGLSFTQPQWATYLNQSDFGVAVAPHAALAATAQVDSLTISIGYSSSNRIEGRYGFNSGDGVIVTERFGWL